MPVNEDRVLLLVNALESGEYDKGIGRLHGIIYGENGIAAHEWCCLGVAGDVSRRNGLLISSLISSCYLLGGKEERRYEKIDGHTTYLGPAVCGWYGFTDDDPVLIKPDGVLVHASSWNDEGDHVTFRDIAAGFRRTFLEGG